MNTIVVGIILFGTMLLTGGCHRHVQGISNAEEISDCNRVFHHPAGRRALLLSRFDSFDSLKRVVQITYTPRSTSWAGLRRKKAYVRISHCAGLDSVVGILTEGIAESVFHEAKKAGIWRKCKVLFQCPFVGLHHDALRTTEELGRRRPWIYGKHDVAFYDIAEAMVMHIKVADTIKATERDLSEKGFLNTFNHITAQAFITAFFSEDVAEFVADVHERQTLPELVTGNFTRQQVEDIENGVVDNYVDMINNEWGQELGKRLKMKYQIKSLKDLTPQVFAHFLNDVQSYHSGAFHIGFEPFRPEDEIVIHFIQKVNVLI